MRNILHSTNNCSGVRFLPRSLQISVAVAVIKFFDLIFLGNGRRTALFLRETVRPRRSFPDARRHFPRRWHRKYRNAVVSLFFSSIGSRRKLDTSTRMYQLSLAENIYASCKSRLIRRRAELTSRCFSDMCTCCYVHRDTKVYAASG